MAISAIGTSLVAIVASVMAVNAYGKDYVLNASKDTHTAIITDVADLKDIVIKDLLQKKRVELSNLEITVFNAKQKGQKIPPHIIKSIVRLKAQIKKLEKKQ